MFVLAGISMNFGAVTLLLAGLGGNPANDFYGMIRRNRWRGMFSPAGETNGVCGGRGGCGDCGGCGA